MNELEIKRKANDFLHKGKYQEAIAEYENLLSAQKKPNPAIVNLIGDLHVKQGDFEKGFEAYLSASRTYAEEGLFHNGIAVGKKVIRLDKEQTEVYGMLGQLYARQGLGMDCVKFLSEYARRMEEAGEYPAALASFAEACEILPEFPDVHASYGDMLEKVDRHEDAAVAFDRAAGACADREMAAEAQAYRNRASALRGETTEPVGDGVSDLMSLRNLDSGEMVNPATRATASMSSAPPAPAGAGTASGSGRFAVYDPANNPDIPPPPPLPGRSAGAPPVAA
ncbi:MAG: tetratricopeptide repeat protein, partial [Gemmatimonadetes bacterium]|nr:tetratricopeptide repeat protein [Gemmatimonadota bacterium]